MSRIAIIDDAPDNAEILQVLLTSIGHNVRVFGKGTDFLQTFTAGAVDLILLDIGLPELNGYDTFDVIREVDPKVPVFAITAYAFDSDREKLLSHGFNLYVRKPIGDVDDFLQRIADVCGPGLPISRTAT